MLGINFRALRTRFFSLSERKARFEAKYPEALRGSRVACCRDINTDSVLMLKLPVINKSKTMVGVRETSIDERRKTDKDKDIDGVSAERINNRVPQNPGGRKYERRLFGKPVLLTGRMCSIATRSPRDLHGLRGAHEEVDKDTHEY
jgi:hypothetical protein